MPKTYNTNFEKYVDFTIGIVVWLIISSLVWGAGSLIFDEYGEIAWSGWGRTLWPYPNADILLCLSPLFFLTNIAVIVIFLRIRRWMGLGVLGIYLLNAVLALVMSRSIPFAGRPVTNTKMIEPSIVGPIIEVTITPETPTQTPVDKRKTSKGTVLGVAGPCNLFKEPNSFSSPYELLDFEIAANIDCKEICDVSRTQLDDSNQLWFFVECSANCEYPCEGWVPDLYFRIEEYK